MNDEHVSEREAPQQDNNAPPDTSTPQSPLQGRKPLSIAIPVGRPHDDHVHPSLNVPDSRSRSPPQPPSCSAALPSPALPSPTPAQPPRPFQFSRGRKPMNADQKTFFDQALPEIERKCKEDPLWEAERSWLLGGPEVDGAQGFLHALVLSGKKKTMTNILAICEKGILRRRIAASERGEPHPAKLPTESGVPLEPEPQPDGDASLPLPTSSPRQSLLGSKLHPINLADTIPQDTHQDTPQDPNKSIGQQTPTSPGQAPVDQQLASSSHAQPVMPSAPKASTAPQDPSKLPGSSSKKIDMSFASKASTAPHDPNKLVAHQTSMSSGQASADQQLAPSSSTHPAMSSGPKASPGHPASHSPLAHSLLFSPFSTNTTTSIANFLVWTDNRGSPSCRLRPVSPADILDMPPIITSELSQLYSNYQLVLQLLDLHKKHGQPVPDTLVYQCHQLKQQVERPWEQLQDSFLKARSRYIASCTPDAPRDPSLRVLAIPFPGLEQVKKAAARLKEQASVAAQAHYDQRRLPKSPALPQPTDAHGGPSQLMVLRPSNLAVQHSPPLNTQPIASERFLLTSASSTATTARSGADVPAATRPQGLGFLPGVAPSTKISSPSINSTTLPLANTYTPVPSHAQSSLGNPLEPVRAHAHPSGQIYHSPKISNEPRFLCISPTTSQFNNRVTDPANRRPSGGPMNAGMSLPNFSRSSLGGHSNIPALTVQDDRYHSSPLPSPTTPIQRTHMSLSSQPSSPNLGQAVQGRELAQMGQQVNHNLLQAHPSSPGTHQASQHHGIQPVVRQGLPVRARTGEHRLEADGQMSGQLTQQHLGALPTRMHRPPHPHVVSQPPTMHQQPLQAGLSVQAAQRSPSLSSIVTETQLHAIHLSERAELEHRHHVEVQALEHQFRRWLTTQLTAELGSAGNGRHQQQLEVVQRMNALVDQKRREFERLAMEMNARQQQQRESVHMWWQRELVSGTAGRQQQIQGAGTSVSNGGGGLALVAGGQLGLAHAMQTGRGIDTGGAKDWSRQASSRSHSPVRAIEGDRRLPAAGGSQADRVASPLHPFPPDSRAQHTPTASRPSATASSISGQKRASLTGLRSASPPEAPSGSVGFRSTKRMRGSLGVLKMVEVARALEIDWGTAGAAAPAESAEVDPVEAARQADPVEAGRVVEGGQAEPAHAGGEVEPAQAGSVDARGEAGPVEAGPVEAVGEEESAEAGGDAGMAVVADEKGEKEDVARGQKEGEGEVSQAQGAGWATWSAGACSASDEARSIRLASPRLVGSVGSHPRPFELRDDGRRPPAHPELSGGRDECQPVTRALLPDHDPAGRAPSAPPTVAAPAPASLVAHGVAGRAPSAPAASMRESQAPGVPAVPQTKSIGSGPVSRAPSVSSAVQTIPTLLESQPVSRAPSVPTAGQTTPLPFKTQSVTRVPSVSDVPQTTTNSEESRLVSRAPSVPAVVQTFPRPFETPPASRAPSLPAVIQTLSRPITSRPLSPCSVEPTVVQTSPSSTESCPMSLSLSEPAVPQTIPTSIQSRPVSRAPSVSDLPETTPRSGGSRPVSLAPSAPAEPCVPATTDDEDEGRTISGTASDQQAADEVEQVGEQGDEEHKAQMAAEALSKRRRQGSLVEALRMFAAESQSAVELIDRVRLV